MFICSCSDFFVCYMFVGAIVTVPSPIDDDNDNNVLSVNHSRFLVAITLNNTVFHRAIIIISVRIVYIYCKSLWQQCVSSSFRYLSIFTLFTHAFVSNSIHTSLCTLPHFMPDVLYLHVYITVFSMFIQCFRIKTL